MATSGSVSEGRWCGPPAPGRGWVLLPLIWCVWLLLSLVPTLLMAPRLLSPGPWLMRETAPSAVLAAGGFFLAAVWPFWRKKGTGSFSGLSEKVPVPFLHGERGGGAVGRKGTEKEPVPFLQSARGVARWLGAGALEFVVLVALAVPFALVAWSVGDGRLAVWPVVAMVGGLGVFGLGLRTAAEGMVPGAARWLMFAVLLVCAGPLILEYAAAETTGVSLPWLLEVSPVFGLVGVGMDGWPAESSWPWVARLWLWPGVGVVLGVVGLCESWRRVRCGRV